MPPRRGACVPGWPARSSRGWSWLQSSAGGKGTSGQADQTRAFQGRVNTTPPQSGRRGTDEETGGLGRSTIEDKKKGRGAALLPSAVRREEGRGIEQTKGGRRGGEGGRLSQRCFHLHAQLFEGSMTEMILQAKVFQGEGNASLRLFCHRACACCDSSLLCTLQPQEHPRPSHPENSPDV